ncbi:hypothetical protein ID866_11786 [Astraeus odoratus]|nr:hypothetical protein ID866_11786 [Astraeus odoratus]
MQTCLHTHTQTECEDAEHYLSGSCQIPSVWKMLNLELLTAPGVVTQTPEILTTQKTMMDNPIFALTNTITHLSNATRHRPKDSGAVCTKVNEPDTFNSMDLKRLHEFLIQCKLNFCHRPQAFCLDSQKVSFALSFLKGIALAWFEPDLLDAIPGTEPAWANDYSEFVIELTTNFSPHDPVGDAEHQLNNLSMKDGSQINKYIIEFNHLTTQVHGYGEGALHHMFYNGLPDHIKDEIAHIGKPPGLINLCTMAFRLS